jgi:predicted nucleic acid-binding protein
LERAAQSPAHVPSHWPFEFANIVVQLERRRKLTAPEAETIFRNLSELRVVVDHAGPSSERVAQVARSTGLSAYDAGFIELAQRLGLPLATRDAALLAAAKKVGLALV